MKKAEEQPLEHRRNGVHGRVNGNPCGPCSLPPAPSEIAFLYGTPDAPAQP